jgi:hypothetical protein
MILDMIQGCRYLRRSTDRWLLSKNSTTQLKGLESWHGGGLLWNCLIPITNTKDSYLYPHFNMTPSQPRLQHLLPKINAPAPMSVSHLSSIRSFFMFKPCHHVFPNASSSKRETALLPNDDVLPTADVFTECFEENLLPNGALLPNSGHRSVSSQYQFFVLTHCWRRIMHTADFVPSLCHRWEHMLSTCLPKFGSPSRSVCLSAGDMLSWNPAWYTWLYTSFSKT